MSSNQFVEAKRLALINLSDSTVSIKPIPEQYQKGFLGGRGLNMVYLYKMLISLKKKGVTVDPFAPENPLIMGTGLLTGTGAPSGSRMNFTTVSPESLVFCDSNMGGFLGSQLAQSGFNIIIIVGKAPKPVYLYIENGNIEIRSAEFLWGKTTSQTQIEFNKMFKSRIEVACIGPAGENLVRYAAIISGLKSAAGRGGAGAVMGSKNLKAVVAGSGKGIPLAYPLEFFQYVSELNAYLSNTKIVKALGVYGTLLLYDMSNELGTIRTKNSQESAFSHRLDSKEFHKYIEKTVSCSSCAVHCRHRNKIKHGALSGGEGPEYSTVGLMGANLGIDIPEEVIELNNIVNDLGLDSSSTGTYLAWVFELFEKGMISNKQTEMELEFGNFRLIKELLFQISYRKKFGNILAEGRRAASLLNVKEDLLIAVKGLPQSDPHDVRFIKSFALGIATSTRGADHLRSRPTLDILPLIPKKVITKLYKANIDRSPTSYKTKEHLVFFSENIYAVQDCLGLCRFICQGWNSPDLLGFEHFSKLIQYANGISFTKFELEKVGKNLINLERWINYKIFNIGFEEDTLPKRYFDDPMPTQKKFSTGEKIDRDEFNDMLQRYYLLRGWLADDGSFFLKNPFNEDEEVKN